MPTNAPWLLYANSPTTSVTPTPSQPSGPWDLYKPQQLAAATSPNGGQPFVPMTGPKLSDFVPDWRTPGKFAYGVGEGLYGMGAGLLNSIAHPLDAAKGIGAGVHNIANDIKDRQYLSALADTINLTGFDEAKLAKMWNEGRGAEAVGTATPTAFADVEGVRNLPKTFAAIKRGALATPAIIRSVATSAGRRALMDSASAVRDTLAARTQQVLRAAADTAHSHVSRLVRGINEADEADIAEKGVEKVGIDTRPMLKGLNEAQSIYRQVGQKMPGADIVAEHLNDFGGSRVSFETAKQLRTDVGAAMEHATGAQKAILSSTYNDLSDALADRASKLDMSKQFDAYNKIHSVLQDYQKHGLLGKLLTTKDSGQFYDDIAKRGNRASIIKLQNTLADYGLQPDALDASLASVKDLHKYLQSGNAGSFIGIFRKIAEHPVGGVLGLIGGGLAGNYLTRMFGAWAGSALAERIAVVRALEKLGVDVPEATASDIGEAAKVMPKGATIGEQLAAKGRELPKVGEPPQNVPPTTGRGLRYAFRGTAPEETGIKGAAYDQASESIEEARDYARMKNGNVQRIDISKLDPNSYEVAGGMNTPNLYRFKGEVPPEAIEQIESYAPKNGTEAAGSAQTPVSFTKDSNGITWAHNLSLSPNPVRIPDEIPDAEREAYAAGKLKQQGEMAAKLKASIASERQRLTPDQVGQVGKSLGLADEEKEAVNRQNRVRETVTIAKRLARGEKELENLEKMKAHIGPTRYKEAVAEISKMLDTLRAQIE